MDGVLTVDMPPEEAQDVLPIFSAKGLDAIFLVSPDSTVERFKLIAQNSSGFIYYVSLKGVTGVKSIDTAAVSNKLSQLREHTDLPIGVGFGIKDAESAQQIAKISDAVVVGSAVVKRVEANKDNPENMIRDISAFLSELRTAIDSI